MEEMHRSEDSHVTVLFGQGWITEAACPVLSEVPPLFSQREHYEKNITSFQD